MQIQTADKQATEVTARALVQRINRNLDEEGLKLVKLRGRAAEEWGEYVIVLLPSRGDVRGWGPSGPITASRIEKHGIELEKLGRELGVMRPSEKLTQ